MRTKRDYKRDPSPSKHRQAISQLRDRREQAGQIERLRKLLSNQPQTSSDGVEAVVGMLILEKIDDNPEILLVQRAERADDPWSGHVGLPGGRIKPSDRSPVEACQREVMEEVGIELSQIGELLGSLPPGFPWNRPELKVQPFIYKLTKKPNVRMNSEIVSAFWVVLSDVPNMRAQSSVTTRVGPRLVDSFLVEGRVVWGFTYRVLNELLALEWQSSR